MFKRTTAINKMRAMTARKKVIQGGTSSGKTYGIIPILIDWAIKNPRKRITVVAESIPAVKDGAVKIFKDIMWETNRWRESQWIGNPMEYTFSNGTVIQFKSFDTVGKAKASGKRDVLFLNEANHIDFEIADALMIRSKETWIDYNPDAEFWVHTEVLKEPNSEFLLLTYHDNEALPEETLEDIQIKLSKAFKNPHLPYPEIFNESNIISKYWANWAKVYVFGEIGNIQGVVFERWDVIEQLPTNARLIYYGVDFGFTTSKFACVAVYKLDGVFIFDEVVYKNNLTNVEAVTFIKNYGYKGELLYCDYAEPKSIQELNNNGLNAVKCESKNDIHKFAIQKLNEQPFLVTKRSENLINELRYYVYDEKTGKPKKSDKDHLMDALTYAVGSGDKYTGHYAVG
jgi:phage terminase large subunit